MLFELLKSNDTHANEIGEEIIMPLHIKITTRETSVISGIFQK